MQLPSVFEVLLIVEITSTILSTWTLIVVFWQITSRTTTAFDALSTTIISFTVIMGGFRIAVLSQYVTSGEYSPLRQEFLVSCYYSIALWVGFRGGIYFTQRPKSYVHLVSDMPPATYSTIVRRSDGIQAEVTCYACLCCNMFTMLRMETFWKQKYPAGYVTREGQNADPT